MAVFFFFFFFSSRLLYFIRALLLQRETLRVTIRNFIKEFLFILPTIYYLLIKCVFTLFTSCSKPIFFFHRVSFKYDFLFVLTPPFQFYLTNFVLAFPFAVIFYRGNSIRILSPYFVLTPPSRDSIKYSTNVGTFLFIVNFFFVLFHGFSKFSTQ